MLSHVLVSVTMMPMMWTQIQLSHPMSRVSMIKSNSQVVGIMSTQASGAPVSVSEKHWNNK